MTAKDNQRTTKQRGSGPNQIQIGQPAVKPSAAAGRYLETTPPSLDTVPSLSGSVEQGKHISSETTISRRFTYVAPYFQDQCNLRSAAKPAYHSLEPPALLQSQLSRRHGHASCRSRYSSHDQISRRLLRATSQSIVDRLSVEGKARADYWHSSFAADHLFTSAPSYGDDRHLSSRRRSYQD